MLLVLFVALSMPIIARGQRHHFDKRCPPGMTIDPVGTTRNPQSNAAFAATLLPATHKSNNASIAACIDACCRDWLCQSWAWVPIGGSSSPLASTCPAAAAGNAQQPCCVFLAAVDPVVPNPNADGVRTGTKALLAPRAPPYPVSTVINGTVSDVQYDGADGDEWPITWGADGAMYTGAGDNRANGEPDEGFPISWFRVEGGPPTPPTDKAGTATTTAENCTQTCVDHGHLCVDDSSSFVNPSCQMGCEIAKGSSVDACKAVCNEIRAAGKCQYKWQTHEFELCNVCPEGSQAFSYECGIGCEFAHGGTRPHFELMNDMADVSNSECVRWHGNIPNLKSSGALSINGTLYWMVSCFDYGDDTTFNRQRYGPATIMTSKDGGKTWNDNATSHSMFQGRLGAPRFVNYGPSRFCRTLFQIERAADAVHTRYAPGCSFLTPAECSARFLDRSG